MFLSSEDYAEELSALQKKREQLQKELTDFLAPIGLERESFDAFLAESAHFSPSDWQALQEGSLEFSKKVAAIDFLKSSFQIQKESEERKEKSAWLRTYAEEFFDKTNEGASFDED